MSLSKKSKIIVSVIVLGLIAGFLGYNYMMKPPATIEEKSVNYTGDAEEFIATVSQSPLEWTDKVVVLNGLVTAKDGLGVKLNEKVYCQFKDGVNISTIKKNQPLKIKGRVIGYDDLLDELKLDQCIIK